MAGARDLGPGSSLPLVEVPSSLDLAFLRFWVGPGRFLLPSAPGMLPTGLGYPWDRAWAWG